MRPSSTSLPTTLSSALWRPMSSKAASTSPRASLTVGAGRHVDGVPVPLLGGPAAVRDAADVVARRDHALGEEAPHRQLAVGAGRAHGDGHRLARRADLQRLLGDDVVLGRRAQRAFGELPHLPARDALHSSFKRSLPSSSTTARKSMPHQLQSTSSPLPKVSKGLLALQAGHSNSSNLRFDPRSFPVFFSSSS